MTERNLNKDLDLGTAYETIRAQKPWRHPRHDFVYQRVLPNATLSPWLGDAHFLQTYGRVKAHTLVDVYRCYELWSLAQQMDSVEGDILEVGVWRGGTGALLAEAVRKYSGKRVFLADTFGGVVKAGKHDTRYSGGEHADTSPQIVENLLSTLSLSNVEILRGVFPEDTAHHVTGKIAMLHCDVDVYLSAKDVVEWCSSRLSVGGAIVFDDYGFSGCEGVTRYCEELKLVQGYRFIYNLNGHALFIRVGS